LGLGEKFPAATSTRMTGWSNRKYLHCLLVAVILGMAAFLLLFRLDHRPFWQDEAETACLAKNVLQYGVPRAFDGVNIISQEQGREYDQNFLWRWSPWAQIYVTAAAFRLGGLTTYAGRLPFAIFGLGCVFMVYWVVNRNFANPGWACLAALLLTLTVPFLLYARQCRYYSLGMALTLMSLYAFREDWRTKTGPAFLLALSLGLLFYTNYLLFLSFAGALGLAAVLLYPADIPWRRTLRLIAGIGLIILPGLFLFRIQKQAMMVSLGAILINLDKYAIDFFQFMFPLPVVIYLAWRWSRIIWSTAALPQEPEERFVMFLGVVILGNILLLSPAPQSELRYLVHLYPLCAIILGWTVCRVWRFQKFSGVLLALLLLGTNWLCLVPMEWLRMTNHPIHNDARMLTFPNLPLRLYLGELSSPYPDVNQSLIKFFQSRTRPGDTILTTYDDLPLQFYTACRVIGGLQQVAPLTRSPDWLVLRWYTRWNRQYDLNDSERLVRELLAVPGAYRRVALPGEDELFGYQPDPYFHHFMPPMISLAPLAVYEKLPPAP
jgi:hypothetical protein